MAIDTMATLANLFKNKYEPEMTKAFNEEVYGLELAQKKTKKFQGDHELVSVTIGRSVGVGSRQESQGIPIPDGATHLQADIPLRRMYKTWGMTHDVIERSKGDAAAFDEALGSELVAGLERMKKEFNFEFYGDGRGVKASIPAGAAKVTMAKAALTAKQIIVDTTRYLEPGDIVAGWTTAAGVTVLANGGQSDALDMEGISVQSVDSPTKVTLVRGAVQATGDTDWVADNVLRLFGNSTTTGAARTDNDISGLRLLADDGTIAANFEGIARAANLRWQGQLINAGATDLTRNILYRLGDKIRRGAGGVLNTLVWDPSMRREYLSLVQQDVRIAPVKELDAGYSREALVMSLGGAPVRLIEDCDVPAGVVYGFDKRFLYWYELSPFEVDQSTGSILKQATPFGNAGTGDAFYGYMRLKGNIGTPNAGAFGCIFGLNNDFATE